MRGSRSSATVAIRCTTLRTTKTTTGSSSADASVNGCHQTRAPDTRAPPAMLPPSTVPWAASAPSTSAPGDVACTVSTNHASSGPESSARKTPVSTAAAKKTQNDSATMSIALAATLTTADAMKTGRRPKASAKPLVGSSRKKTVSPAADETVSDWATESPRSSCHRVSSPTTSPTGNQRVKLSTRKTRRAAAGERTAYGRSVVDISGHPASGAGRGRGGRRRRRPRCVGPADCPVPHGDSAR